VRAPASYTLAREQVGGRGGEWDPRGYVMYGRGRTGTSAVSDFNENPPRFEADNVSNGTSSREAGPAENGLTEHPWLIKREISV